MRLTGPKIGRNFSLKNIINDLKTALVSALQDKQKTVFVLEDHMLESSDYARSIFTTVNYLLSTGSFFMGFDHDQIVGIVRENFQGKSIDVAVREVFKIAVVVGESDLEEIFEKYPNMKKYLAVKIVEIDEPSKIEVSFMKNRYWKRSYQFQVCDNFITQFSFEYQK